MITYIAEEFKGEFDNILSLGLWKLRGYMVTTVNTIGQVKPLRNICKIGSNFSRGLKL
jgi:hypothetical protein